MITAHWVHVMLAQPKFDIMNTPIKKQSAAAASALPQGRRKLDRWEMHYNCPHNWKLFCFSFISIVWTLLFNTVIQRSSDAPWLWSSPPCQISPRSVQAPGGYPQRAKTIKISPWVAATPAAFLPAINKWILLLTSTRNMVLFKGRMHELRLNLSDT